MTGRGGLAAELRRMAAIGALVVREHAVGYVVVGALGALATLGLTLGGGTPPGGGSVVRIALRYGSAWSELAVFLATALTAGLAFGQALGRRRARIELARPISRPGYLLAYAGGSAVVGALAGGAALLVLLGGVRLHAGTIESLRPRTVFAPHAWLVADPAGRPVPAPRRVTLRTGDDLLVRFRGLPRAELGGALRLRLRPATVLREGMVGSATVTAEVRVVGDGAPSAPRPVAVGHRRASELALPLPGAAASAVLAVDVLLTVRSPNTVLAFDRRSTGAGRAGASYGVVVLGAARSPISGLALLVAGRGVLAIALGVAGCAFAALLQPWSAVALTAVMGLVARLPGGVSALAGLGREGAVDVGGHTHRLEPVAGLGVLRPLLEALQWLVAALPDLGRLDASAALVAGMQPTGSELAMGAAALLPHLLLLVLFGWFVLSRRDVP